jgi:uncharacterized protein RhaS with RHS repeats
MYDSRLGRWLSVDYLASIAPSWNPYRYCFNNPILFVDPFGLFEDKATAKKYAENNGIKTGWFRHNKIVENKDGAWSIENRKEKSFVQEIEIDGVKEVLKGALAVGGKKTEARQVSISVAGALAGGIGLELGYAQDNKNDWGIYFRFSGEIGYGGGVGINWEIVNPTDRPITMEDFIGYDINIIGELGPFSGNKGGSQTDKERRNIWEKGKVYTFGGIGNGKISDLKAWKLRPRLAGGLRSSHGQSWLLWSTNKK